MKQQMLSKLITSYSLLNDAYEAIPDSAAWHRRNVQEYLASVQIRDLEEKINQQCLIVLSGPNDTEKQAALGRVTEGMDYLVRLVMHQIERVKA